MKPYWYPTCGEDVVDLPAELSADLDVLASRVYGDSRGGVPLLHIRAYIRAISAGMDPYRVMCMADRGRVPAERCRYVAEWLALMQRARINIPLAAEIAA